MQARFIVLASLILGWAGHGAAQDRLVAQGYDHFYNLEYDQAIADFKTNIAQRPDDPSAWNHLAHAILYRAMYRSGALESQLVTGSNPFLRRDKVKTTSDEDQEFYNVINKSIGLCRAKLGANPDAADTFRAMGVAYGLRANYNFLVRKSWTDALHDASRANDVVRKAIRLEPSDVDARLIPGVYDYVAGSLPWGYRFLSFLAGFHGNRERGMHTLETVAREGTTDNVDAQILLIAIYRREKRPAEALPLLNDLIPRYPRNHLLRFEVVQMYSDLGDRDNAMREIDHIWMLHREGAPGYADLMSEKIDYLEGNFLFWYNDLDRAEAHLKKVTAKAGSLDLNTAIMAWMRLGQTYDLEGQRKVAVAAYREAVAMAPNSEVGKESQRYIGRPYKRAQPAVAAESAQARN
ncbi:MAG TPA: tetratricopeptide repeat protein [Bryobacteraceae bacterium]|nr:tetratricopeptide repeat protein [Bryobacteraceae bacterium]